jgi:microcystin-dependent protein
MDDKNIAIVVISLILIILAVLIYSKKYLGLVEGFDIDKVDLEAIQNVAGIYNSENMVVSNISLTKSLTVAADGKISFLPKGIIVAWNGDVAPAGWALCNGQNGTPDLQDKFVLSKAPNTYIGKKGGNWKVTLSVDNLPAHNHEFGVGGGNDKQGGNQGTTEGLTCDNCQIKAWTKYTGGNVPFEISPPYYVLAYIMKL